MTTWTAYHIAMFFLSGQRFTSDCGQNSSLQIDDALVLQSPHLFFTLLCFSHSLFEGISLFTSFMLADGHIGCCLNMFNTFATCNSFQRVLGRDFCPKPSTCFRIAGIALFSFTIAQDLCLRSLSTEKGACMSLVSCKISGRPSPKWKPGDSH